MIRDTCMMKMNTGRAKKMSKKEVMCAQMVKGMKGTDMDTAGKSINKEGEVMDMGITMTDMGDMDTITETDMDTITEMDMDIMIIMVTEVGAVMATGEVDMEAIEAAMAEVGTGIAGGGITRTNTALCIPRISTSRSTETSKCSPSPRQHQSWQPHPVLRNK